MPDTKPARCEPLGRVRRGLRGGFSMMVQSGVWALLACLFVAGEPAEDPDRHVTIRGTTYEIYPPEKLRARGFPVTDLPREENAAFLYIDAINMLGPEEAELPISEAAAGEWPDGEAGERLNAYLESQQPVLDLARAASRMPD